MSEVKHYSNSIKNQPRYRKQRRAKASINLDNYKKYNFKNPKRVKRPVYSYKFYTKDNEL